MPPFQLPTVLITSTNTHQGNGPAETGDEAEMESVGSTAPDTKEGNGLGRGLGGQDTGLEEGTGRGWG